MMKNAMISGKSWINAVSDTHLDVYKRQILPYDVDKTQAIDIEDY